jgi:protein-S-isoprenylcysteine O-methyltransferase Ste14
MPSDQPAAAAPPTWAIIGTIIFTIVVPGSVVVLVPYLLSGWRINPPLLGTPMMPILGAAMILAALPFFIGFEKRFVIEGRGTPAPIAPTERLVTGGTYQRVRNPGYISVVAMVLGEGLLLGDTGVLLYAIILAIGFHIFVLVYEEPTLRASYGAEFEKYCAQVPRWIPRLRTARTPRTDSLGL